MTTGMRSWRSDRASFGRGGDDRERPPHGLRRRVAPAGPESGERQRPTIVADHAVRLADRALALPLVERIDRHEASMPPERVAEGRARRQGLGARVEHPRADLRVGRPMRDEAPAVGGDGPPLLALDDHERLVGRGDVEARAGVVDERLGAEDLGQLRGRSLLGESPAHRPSLAARNESIPAPSPVRGSWLGSSELTGRIRWTGLPRISTCQVVRS